MNQLAFNGPHKKRNPTCSDVITMAEQELAAFFSAVTELYGSEQATLSAEDWLHELMRINDLPTSTREWRLLTVKISARLARRVQAPPILNGQVAELASPL